MPAAKQIIHVCVICGNEFAARTPKHRTCSATCRTTLHRRRERARYKRVGKRGGTRPEELTKLQMACAAPRRKLAAESTDARPGSPEKLAVLIARSLAGETLWHPDDATYGDDE